MRTSRHYSHEFASRSRMILLALGVLVALVTAPGAAAKLSPGVHSNPNTPASSEYAVPLNTARGGGGGGHSSSGSLFGSGITSGGPTTGAGSTAGVVSTRGPAQRHATTRRHRGRHRRRAAAPAPRAVPVTVHPATPPATLKVLHPGGGSGLVWMVGVAVLVLLLGGGGAALLANRRRPGGPLSPARARRGASELS